MAELFEPEGYEVFRHWSLYERVFRFNYMRHREIIASVSAAIAELPQPLRVLDLGCGAGELAWALLEQAAVSEYLGIDLSADAVNQLTRKGPPGTIGQNVRVEGICGEMLEQLGRIPAARFDLVLASYSIHHFPRARKPPVLREIERVLAPRGTFIWVDLVCQEGQSAEHYLQRICGQIRGEWNSLSPEERESICAHVLASDFPEQASLMGEMASSCSLSPHKQLYQDDHYGASSFQSAKKAATVA
jgi:ubiquinone/menaquinone biosynthesis C-methylase UbiE